MLLQTVRQSIRERIKPSSSAAEKAGADTDTERPVGRGSISCDGRAYTGVPRFGVDEETGAELV